MAFIQLPKDLHEDFSALNVKPSCALEVDWENDIVKRNTLKNAIVAVSDTQTMDLVTGEIRTSTSPSSKNSGYDGVYINNDGNLGTIAHVISSGTFVVHAKCTAPYATGASRYLINWVGSGELVRLEYNGFSSGRNWQLTTRGGFGSTIIADANPAITSQVELENADMVVAGWDLDVGSSISVGPLKDYSGSGGASTDDTNERSIDICSTNWIGVVYSIFAFEDDLTTEEKESLRLNPYQLVKPVEMPFFIAASTGGTVVDVSLTLGMSAGQTNSGQATAGASITLAQEVGVSDSGQGNANASTDLAAQLGITTSSIATFNTDVALSNVFGYSSSGQATAQVLLTEGLTLEQSVSAIAQAVASVTFSHSNGYAVSTAGLTVDVSTSMGLSMDMSPLVTVALNGSITLNSTLGDQVVAQANTLGTCDLAFQIGMQVAARALAEASITISAVTSIVNTGSSIIIGVITPDSRSYTIEVDNRDFLILAENRDYEVK